MDETQNVYELVEEVPPQFIAYRVDWRASDPTWNVVEESRKMSTLPGVRAVNVQIAPEGDPVIVVTVAEESKDDNPRILRVGSPGWLVIRPEPHAAMHHKDPLKTWTTGFSGRFMFYSEEEFYERYTRSSVGAIVAEERR